MPTPDIKTAIATHLADWGLRRFDTGAAYDQWQRAGLTSDELATLLRLSGQRRGGADAVAEVAFYDYTAQPRILPGLYSQRYDYYLTVGAAVAERIGQARSVLDAGCGIGVLTTFYAQQFPRCSFTGLDRSAASIAVARERAAAKGVQNVRFECLDMDRASAPGTHDLVIATQALLQTEQDRGLPSRDWRTFERANDQAAQDDFERRTGLTERLDRLCGALASNGRLIICEKTRHLARRVPFQRALAARGFVLLEKPLPVSYAVVEEKTEDGPLYVLGRSDPSSVAWDESPEQTGQPLDLAGLAKRPPASDAPLYEDHTTAAQQAWAGLPTRRVLQETTKEEQDGRQVHVELGESQGLTYLYCANTFDQRQLVIVENQRAEMLTQYYQELLQGLEAPAS